MGIAKKIGITIGILFGIILAVGVVVASTLNVTDRASDIVVKSDELKEAAVESSNVADKVDECTREVPKVENRPYDKFVSSQCLIEKAQAVGDCKAYTDLVLVEYDMITSLGNVKHVRQYFTQVEECVTKVALQNHDVSACNSLDDNNNCVIKYVEEFEEPQTCRQATDSQNCYRTVSLRFGFHVCNLIENADNRADCGTNYLLRAQYKDDYSTDKIGERCTFLHKDFGVNKLACQLDRLRLDGMSKDDLLGWTWDSLTVCLLYNSALSDMGKELLNEYCTTNIGEYSADGLTACLRFDSPIRSLDVEKWDDYCIASIGVYLNDLSICDQTGQARAECYAFVAVTDDSIGLDDCDKLGTGVSFCYMHVAYRLDDIRICDMPKVTDNKDNCIRLVKSKTQQ